MEFTLYNVTKLYYGGARSDVKVLTMPGSNIEDIVSHDVIDIKSIETIIIDDAIIRTIQKSMESTPSGEKCEDVGFTDAFFRLDNGRR